MRVKQKADKRLGRGNVLMIDRCRERGLPDPIWTSNEKLGATVTFCAPEVEAQSRAQSDKVGNP